MMTATAVKMYFVMAAILRRKTLARPAAIRLLRVLQAIVQATGTSLPEFEFVRDDTVAAPPVRPGDRLAVEFACDVISRLGRVAAREPFFLRRPLHAPPAF